MATTRAGWRSSRRAAIKGCRWGEALAAASREGAWLSFDEGFKGTLEIGKAADLVILSEDLLTVDEARIPEIVSDLTVTGRVVLDRSAARVA